jgi:hypothetical protein
LVLISVPSAQLPNYEIPRFPKLLNFFVRRMLAAPLAKFIKLQTTRCGLLVFGGGVIAFFAISTLQCHDFTHKTCL